MLKEKAFKSYLLLYLPAQKSVDYYLTMCRKVETNFGDGNLYGAIHSGKNVDFSKAVEIERKIELSSFGKTEKGNLKTALRAYVGFCCPPCKDKMADSAASATGTDDSDAGDAGKEKSAGKTSKYPIPENFAPGPLVQYYSDVPASERDEFLRSELEKEYPLILTYAQKVLGLADDEMKFIPVYLSNKEPMMPPFKVKPNYLNRLRKKADEGNDFSQIQWNILETGKIPEMPVLGCFFPGKAPYIEIYYRHLPLGAPMRINRGVNVLAHEYMHFLHYNYAVRRSVGNPFKKEELNEALAEFFEVEYSLNRGPVENVKLACQNYELWLELDGSGWPYAYALKFFPKPYQCNLLDYTKTEIDGAFRKFQDVFKLTGNPSDACRALNRKAP